VMLIVAGGLAGDPIEALRSALIDGATTLATFLYISLSLIIAVPVHRVD